MAPIEAQEAVVRVDRRRAVLTVALTTGLLTVLTIVSAFLRFPIPGSSIPFTMQVYVVLLAGLVGGITAGGLSQILYVALGATGLPVFAVGAGLVGPTGGYLAGFMIAAVAMGAVTGGRRAGTLRLSVGALAGLSAIYASGFLHLVVVWRMNPAAAFTAGVLPFLPLDMIKAALAVMTARSIRG